MSYDKVKVPALPKGYYFDVDTGGVKGGLFPLRVRLMRISRLLGNTELGSDICKNSAAEVSFTMQLLKDLNFPDALETNLTGTYLPEETK